jgi:hypothetical protein
VESSTPVTARSLPGSGGVPIEQRGELLSPAYVQLAEDPLQMAVDRPNRHDEASGDLAVGQPLRDQNGDLRSGAGLRNRVAELSHLCGTGNVSEGASRDRERGLGPACGVGEGEHPVAGRSRTPRLMLDNEPIPSHRMRGKPPKVRDRHARRHRQPTGRQVVRQAGPSPILIA